MKFAKFLPILAVALLSLSAGCASKPPEKTATKEGMERWNLARAGVLYGLAKDQYESGNLDDCRKTLIHASKFAPDHVLIHLLFAKVSIEQGQLEAAELQLNHVRELDAHNAEAEYLTGVVNQRWQKSQEAYEAYARAAEKNPNELAYLLAESEMLVQMDQNPKALQLLKDKLNFFENSPAIRDAVGQLLMQDAADRSQNSEVRIQKYAEAAMILRQASSLAPEEQQIREHYGMALYYSKQYREAISVMERLLKDEKYNKRADIHTALGECQMEIDQPREARDHFELASQLDPGTPRVWLNLAKTALRLNDLKRAELSLKKAMSMAPTPSDRDLQSQSTAIGDLADANLLMGYLSLQQSKFSDALASFRKASALNDKDPVSVCMTGFVLEKMGRSDEAIRYYSTALKLKPNDELATSLLAKVQVSSQRDLRHE